MRSSTYFLMGALAASQAAATWNIGANPYNNPKNTDNSKQCTDKQKGGFDWSDLTPGNDIPGGYGGFDFSGFKCKESQGKRDGLTKRTFGGKAAGCSVSKQKPAPPKIACQKDNFSVDYMDVSVDVDIDIEFHYGMPDGSTCKQVSPCSKGGSTVKNTQCGGAKDVTFKIPSYGKKDDCNLDIHHIGFNCEKPEVPKYTPVPGCGYGGYGGNCGQSSTPIVVSSKPVQSSKPAQSTPVVSTPAVSTPVYTPPGQPSSKPVPSSPVNSPSVPAGCGYGQNCNNTSNSPQQSTPTPAQSTPISVPQQSTPTPAKSTPVTSVPSSCVYGKDCASSPVPSSKPAESSPVPQSTPGQNTPVYSSPVGSPSSPAGTPTPPVGSSTSNSPVESTPVISKPVPTPTPDTGCPAVVGRCLNTWMKDCKDNTDKECYCKKTDFTKQVIDCITAWGGEDKDVKDALSCFVGICAPFVPQNPGIVTQCPPNIPLGPKPTPSSSNVPVQSPATSNSPVQSSNVPVVSSPAASSPAASSPVVSSPVASSPAVTPAPSSSPVGVTSNSPVQSSAAPPPPAGSTYLTTITVSQVVTVPCVVSTGVSSGFTVPGSSTLSTYQTTVTVPQIQFSSSIVTVSGTTSQIIDVVQTPVPVSATLTGPVAGNPTSTFGTNYIPTAPSATLSRFTGAAAPVATGAIGFGGAAFAAAVAVLAL